MVRGDRVDGIEYARRVNAAVELVGTGMPASAAAHTMAGRYGVSVRQARRYVEQAVAAGRIEVPEANVVFTVKLPGSLAGRGRGHAPPRDAPPLGGGGTSAGPVPAARRPGEAFWHMNGRALELELELECVFDRHAQADLSAAYAILVPQRRARVPAAHPAAHARGGPSDDQRGDLRP